MKRNIVGEIPQEYKDQQSDSGVELDDICPDFSALSMSQIDTLLHGSTLKSEFNPRAAKFLLPVLPSGRASQYRAFTEALILSIYTDRTIVLPPFFDDDWFDLDGKEDIDQEMEFNHKLYHKERALDPFSQLGYKSLQSLTKVVHWREFIKTCNGRLSTIFVGHGNNCRGAKFFRMKMFEDLTGLKMVRTMIKREPEPRKMCEVLNGQGVTIQPENIAYNRDFQTRINLPFNKTFVKNFYSDDKACALDLYEVYENLIINDTSFERTDYHVFIHNWQF